MDPMLLDILVCPATHVPVVLLDEQRREALNEAVRAGKVTDTGGEAVGDPIAEALITEDGRTVYRIENDIPIMLIESGIDTGQLGW
jgi:uncharacterized protein YbaR (Trm112 family)